VFVPSIKEYQLANNNKREKVLLLHDSASPHPSSDILNEINEFIQVLNLPPNIIVFASQWTKA
jgi:hypothetical protein